jgi:two-component sensor histidine kinase
MSPIVASMVCALLAASASGAQTPPQAIPFVQVFINDNKTPLPEGAEITIPYNASQVRFLITPVPGIVRYRLQGSSDWEQRNRWLFAGDTYVLQDRNWQTRDGAMFIGVRYYNKDGDFVDETRFLASGRSPGWKGKLEGSTFTPRKETVLVPPDAYEAEVFTTSAGPPSAVGLFAVTDCNLYAGDRSLDIGSGWIKQGSRPSMALRENIDGHSAFVIDDTDIRGHADWVSPRRPVTPGQSLTLDWKELYSNGMGDALTAVYGTLPVGDYRFIVEEVDLAGTPKRHYTVHFRIPPPFWRTAWFWMSCLGGTAVLGLVGGILWSRAASRKREERQQLIEEERRRIARDLHDDLGAQLSQMILASSFQATIAPSDSIKQSFRSLNELAHTLSASLSKTIWMLNPENDNLESLSDFLCRMLAAQCKSSGVKSRSKISEMPASVKVSNELRHNASLAVREGVTNALRHASPSEIWLHAKFRAGRLFLDVIDDGVGLPPVPPKGNGLSNMKKRAEMLGGVCEFFSPASGGAQVHFEFPISPIYQRPKHEKEGRLS